MKPSHPSIVKSPSTIYKTFLPCLIKEISFDHKSGKNFMILALVLSYLQILSQSIDLVFQYIPSDQSGLSSTTQLIERIFNFDDIFSYGYDDGILLIACICMLIYFILIIVSFCMAIYGISASRKYQIAAQIVSVLLQIHALVVFWPIRNLLNRLRLESRLNNLSKIYLHFGRETIITGSIVFSVINVVIGIIPNFLLYHILPSKNPLSSRNYFLDQLSFLQKIIISFAIDSIQILSENPGVLLVGDLVFSLIRQGWFAYDFPRYSITTFKLESYFINITTMLPLLSLIIFIINEIIDVPLTTETVIVVFLVLCVMTILLIKYRLATILRKILFRPVKSLGSKKALYKLLYLKHLAAKTTAPNEHEAKIGSLSFYFFTVNNCTGQLFEEFNHFNSSQSLDLHTKAGLSRLKQSYLEYIVSCFPRQDEYKLMLARLYAKNLTLYTLAIKLLAKIKYGFASFHMKVSAELLYVKIQEYIMRTEQTKETKVNLCEYISIKSEQESLQSEIKKQLDLHSKFWQEYSNNHSSFSELQKLSHMIDKQKLSIKKRWSRIENRHSKNLAYLYLLYGKYQIVLNNSLEKGLKYIQKHKLLSRPSDPTLPLNSSNFLDNNNFSVTISTRQENLGNIIHSSESIQKVLGYQKSFLIGSSIGVLMSPYISERHNSFISEYIKTGKRTFMGEPQSVLVKDASGNLRKASVFANIHPSLNEEVCLIGLFRLLEDHLEYILVTPEGEIDSYSEAIGTKLGLQRKHAHIENISRNYEEIMGPRESKIVDNIEENFQNEMKERQDEKEGLLLTPKEDPILSSKLQLLSNRTSPYTLFSEGNFLLSQEVEIEPKQQKKDTFYQEHIYKKQRIAFNAYSLVPNKLTQTFPYECTIDTILFRNGCLRVLAIEMIDENQRKEKENVKTLLGFDQRRENDKIHQETSPLSPANFNRLSSFPLKDTQPITNRMPLEAAKGLPDRIMGSSMSTSTASHGRKKTSTYLEDALNAKYYPKLISRFVIAILLLICATLSIEGLLHQNTEAAMNKIKDLTTTMNLANSRAYAFSMLARNTRAAYYIREQYLAPGLAVTKSTNASLFNNMGTFLLQLSSSNSNLQLAIQNIEGSFKESFIATNIRMYDVNPDLTLGSYRNFSTFMAIDVLSQQILNLRATYTTTFPLYEFHTIFQNSVNDLLESTVQAVDIIYNEIQTSSNNIESTLRIYQILSMCLIVFRFILSCWFFYWVYISEIDLGQKFLLIVPKQVEMVQQKLNSFGKSLEREDTEQLINMDIENSIFFAKVVNTRIDKSPKTSGMIRQYWKRIIVYLTLLILLIAQVNFTFIHVKNKFKSLNQQIDSLAKIESMQYEIAILSFTIAQIVCNDYVTTIRNRDLDVELQADLDTLQTTTEVLMNTFTEDDGTINPIVAPFFFGNICDLVTSAQLATCLGITKGAKEFGLFSLLSRHYTVITTLYHNFQLSNKTFPELQNLVVWSVTNQVPSLNVINDLTQTIMTRLSNDLSKEWGSIFNDIRIVVSLNTFSLVIFWPLVLRFVHLYFFNFYNRFKGMLKIVPFDIILSNATLKGIMIISSKNKLSRIKNDI